MDISVNSPTKFRWNRHLYITGLVAFIVGALDPMEGSVVICAGAALLAFSAYKLKDRHAKHFLIHFLLIATGVISLFVISDQGGLGPNDLSWWWGLFILPYPLAWLSLMVLLIIRAFQKKKTI